MPIRLATIPSQWSRSTAMARVIPLSLTPSRFRYFRNSVLAALFGIGAAGTAMYLAPQAPTNVHVSAGGAFAGSDTFDSALNTNNWVVLDREGDQSNSET